MSIRSFLIGGDYDMVYDIVNHKMWPMYRYSVWYRFVYLKYIVPVRLIDAWMDSWDYKFRMRYVDRWLKPSKPSVFEVYLSGLNSRGVQ